MDKIDELKSKIRENSLVISRVPKNTKEEFIAFANEEFAGDYGMTLKNLFDNFKLWKMLFENLDMKLDNILEIISQPEQKEEKSSEDEIKLVSGRKIRLKGGNNKEK
jgi:hypothetical protein